MAEIFIEGKNISIEPTAETELSSIESKTFSIGSKKGRQIISELSEAYRISRRKIIKGLRKESMEL